MNNMKFKRKFKSILGTILTVTVLLSSSSAVFAAGPTTSTDTSTINNAISQQNDKAKAFVDMLDPYVTVVNNQFILDVPKDIQKKIDPAELKLANEKINETNKSIKLVFCKNFFLKVASNFSIVLQLHFPQCCKLHFPVINREIQGLQTFVT